jgi:TrkA domain protein
MPRITETTLPGVGVRHEFTSARGERVAVISHRSGRREIAVSRRADPDTHTTVLDLGADDAAVLATVLGAPAVAATVTAMQRVDGLAIDWISVGRPTTIGDGQFRTRTGASIVAVIRGDETHPAPGPEFALRPGDVAVAVGTSEGLEQLQSLVQ